MDFIEMYGLPVWIIVALVFVLLGAWLTSRRSFTPPSPEAILEKRLPSPRRMRALSIPGLPRVSRRASTFCRACGKQDDTPGACYCWFCGQSLMRNRRQVKVLRWTTGTRLVKTAGQ